jgi:UDP-N-acetyl-D-mannosaminuronic acid dehydrogenase
MVKLMENTYRDINIAIANEFARLGEQLGVDSWRAIELANLHPRVNILRPGPGVGGHCISVDPWFLVEAAPDVSQLIQQAREVNDGQPEYVVQLVKRSLGGLKGKVVAALGLAYKPDVDDLRESPAITVVERLVKSGAIVQCYEPFAPTVEVPGVANLHTLEEALEGAEAIVLLVDHAQFRSLDPFVIAKQVSGGTVVDTRGVWAKQAWEQAGFRFVKLGSGEE